jgi:phospholipid/cholesterol/gamma-HCH transport system substrate-binding protein
MTHTRLIGVGAFVIGGLLLFAVGLFMIGSRRMLFVDRFQVNAEFARVTGLQRGAIVRVSGMDAGEVEAILVPAGPRDRFRVQMRVRADLHQLVRSDSVASIQTDGLVGNKFVQIETGTERAPPAPEGSTIASREPFDFADLMVQTSQTVKTLDQTIVQLRGDIEKTLDAIGETANEATSIIEEVGGDVKAITVDGRKIVKDIQAISAEIGAGRGTIGRLVKEDEIYNRAATVAKDAEQVVSQMRETITEARKAMASLNASLTGSDGPVKGVTSELRETMTYAREAMADLAENTESLKRSFLFRGLFQGRGFYDLDTVSIEEYKGGDFAGKNRVPLRIWLDAGVLFMKTADGNEELSPDGKRRLDSAMGTFLKYPRQLPLVIEGYAVAPTEEEAHLRSAARAAEARAHLIRRFALGSNTTGLMPMGAQADQSPRGDGTWEGVAVVLWMPRDLFAKPSRGAPGSATDSR